MSTTNFYDVEEIAKLAGNGDKPAETLGKVTAWIARGLQADVCSAYLLEPDRVHLVLAATLGLRRECVGTLRLALHEGLAGLVAEQVRPVAVERVQTHPRFKYFQESGEERLQSFLGVPLIDCGVLQGVLVVQTEAPRVFSESEIEMLTEAAAQVAPIVSEARTLDKFIAPAQEKLWAVARNLTSPLSQLVAAARSVSRGDLSARSNVRTADEIGVLGASFDAMAERLERQHIATIGALASAIDARDPYTAGHSVRVGDLSYELGREMGLPRPSLQHLRVGGLLHDIGKIGIRDTVLLKPGKLDDDERRLIEQHPTIGLRILEWAELPKEVLEIVGGHHERLDGTGYPLGLSADDLTLFPRITAVADMYDALTTDRPYRRGLSPQEALRMLWRDAEGGIVDPEVVATLRRFARHWESRRSGAGTRTSNGIESLEALRERGDQVA